MNKSITMKTALAALACTACVSASAQKQYPEQEKMKPGMSEYWTPQPKVVTPGDIKTNSAPSDAIVLFDGKDLSAWQNAKGGPAEWIVKDGVFTVDKKKGDILTKQKFENFQLHIEWCVPENITGTSQGRGNSGIFLQDMYEIQVLDCYNNETYVNGQTDIQLHISLLFQRHPLIQAVCKRIARCLAVLLRLKSPVNLRHQVIHIAALGHPRIHIRKLAGIFSEVL